MERGSKTRAARAPIRYETVQPEVLIGQCIAGDDAAKAFFFTEYRPLVSRAIARKLSAFGQPYTGPEVEDLCHDLFLRLLAPPCPMLQRLQQPRALHSWLITVAQNHTVDHMRREMRRDQLEACLAWEERAPCEAAPARVIAEERTALVRARLAELSDQERVILELFFLHGMKYAEIAEMMRMNINTVSARLRRGKLKLRKLFENAVEGA